MSWSRSRCRWARADRGSRPASWRRCRVGCRHPERLVRRPERRSRHSGPREPGRPPGARGGPLRACAGPGGAGSPSPSCPAPGAGSVLGLRVELLGGRVHRALVDDGLVPVVGVARVQILDLLLGQPAGHQRSVGLVRHVAAQVPGHRLEPGHGVDRCPGVRLVAVALQVECRVLGGERRALVVLEVGVDTRRVGLEEVPGLGRELLVLLLRDLAPSERAQEGVGLHLAVAEHLRQTPGGHVAAYVHLPEAVLGLDITLSQEEVLGLVRVDLGDSASVPLHAHRGGEALEFERARRLREGVADGTDAPVGPASDACHKQQHDCDHDQTGASRGLLGGHRCPSRGQGGPWAGWRTGSIRTEQP